MASAATLAARNAVRETLNRLVGDKYEIQQWIGGGGMAEVFLARHCVTGAEFAVKVLNDQLAGEPRIVARFIEEARTAATLGGHPNIASVFDIGEGEGVHFLVMPYVEGEDLKSYLKERGRLSVPETLEVIKQVAEALTWACERNVVHRDLKPSNIRLDCSGRAMVIDFGIAKVADVPSGLTQQGETLGTPYYMSPEQIKGEKCDHRSDLYSLGIMFFELLTGDKPLKGDTLAEIQLAHVNVPPRPLASVLPDVDPRIGQVIDHLLAKDPKQRYQTARALLGDLAVVSQGLPPVALKPRVDRPPMTDTPLPPPPATEQTRTIGRNGPVQTIVEPPQPQVRKEPERQAAEPKPVTETAGSKRPGWLIPAAIGLVLVAAAAAFFLLPGKPKTAVPAGLVELPKTISDTHGEMLLVPAGKFIFGADVPEIDNKRQEVVMPAYYVAKTAVSNSQYASFAQATGHKPPESATFGKEPSLPVVGVNFQDAQSYCEWAGGRLPTEQEWEKAARGTDGRTYPWGNGPLPMLASFVPVDQQNGRESPVGALNMSGNVFEWTSSVFPATDAFIKDMEKQLGSKDVSRDWRSTKGCGYHDNAKAYDYFVRTFLRRGWPVNVAGTSIGIRCVKDAK